MSCINPTPFQSLLSSSSRNTDLKEYAKIESSTVILDVSLKKMISVLWESSSDVIVISVEDHSGVSSMVSPTFQEMLGVPKADQGGSEEARPALSDITFSMNLRRGECEPKLRCGQGGKPA